MFAPGHVGIATLVYAPVAAVLFARGHRRLGWAGFAIVAVAGVAPDVDVMLSSIPHRGPTHTVWAAVALAVVVRAVLPALPRAFATEHPEWPALLCALGVGSHLLGDVLTPMGIRPFAPLVEWKFTLDLVPARNPEANATLFAIGTIAALVVASNALANPSIPAPEPDVAATGSDVTESGSH